MIARFLNWGMLIGHGVFALAIYPSLPAQIPGGLTASGAPRGMQPTSLVSWLLLWGIAAGVFAMMQVISSRLGEQPELFNFSEKQRLLALPKPFQASVVAAMRQFMHTVGALTGSLLFVVQVALWRSALGEKPTTLLSVVLVLAVMTTPLIFLLIGRVSAAVEVAETEFRRSAASPAERV